MNNAILASQGMAMSKMNPMANKVKNGNINAERALNAFETKQSTRTNLVP